MLTGQLGIRLILKLGKSEPVPAPYNVITALRSVRVINNTDDADGFQMTFSLSKTKMGEYSLVSSGLLDPKTRVVIGAALGLSITPLIHGVINHHQIVPSNEPGQSTLTVTGDDLSVELDLTQKDLKHVGSDSTIAGKILGAYGRLKIAGKASKTTENPTESKRVTQQTGESDLQFLKWLAKENGFVFYIEPLSMSACTAYWGPEKLSGPPQPSLKMDMGSATNVTALDFSQDALSPIKASGYTLDPKGKNIAKVTGKPLSEGKIVQKASEPRRETVVRCMANKTSGLAKSRADAAVTNEPDPITATGSLDTVRYGGVLRARRGVEVSGAGKRNDGLYNVRSVTHEIEPGKYTQQFTLTRDGTGPH